MAISFVENRWQDSERWERDGMGSGQWSPARRDEQAVEKADETRVIFIVRGWWGDKQHIPSTGGRRDALHFRYDDNSKHPTTLQLFIVTYLSTTGRLWPIRETWNRTPRGVWLKKEATEWNLGGAEDWESGWEKRGEPGGPGPSIFPSHPRRVQL